MERWTEADLVKLSVKELKLLARKSSVNPNSKKADLVKALLTNVKDIADQSENGGARMSGRVTRSRVSIWQSSDETLSRDKETNAKFKAEEDNLNSRIKDSVDDKRVKRKKVRAADNIDAYDTSEMFPLVSSIQLASKSLVEITNKDISRHKQEKQDEFQAAVATSKRSKQNKVQNKKVEFVLLTNNTGVSGVVSDVIPCLTVDTNQQDVDLNNTFIVEKKRSPSQDKNRKSTKRKQLDKEQDNEEQNLHPSKQLAVHQQTINNKNQNGEISKENQQELKLPSVLEVKNVSEKPKRGKKRKSESPVDDKIKISLENSVIQCDSLETCDLVGNTHGPSKKRRKKGKKENPPVEDLRKITDKSPETSDSKIAQIKKEKIDDSEKRALRSSPLPENAYNSDTSFPEADMNKSKSKKVPLKTNLLSNTENAKDEGVKRGKNKNQNLSLEHDSLKTQALKDLVETSLNSSSRLRRCSRQSGTVPNFQNESTVVNGNNIDSVKKEVAQKYNNSNGNILEVDVSADQGETGQNTIQVPIRSSTFILPDSSVTKENKEMPVLVPRRNSTFILSNPSSETKTNFSKNADKRGKSIGQRIIQSSIKRGEEKTLKKDPGSAVKKTSVKSTTSGSIIKKKVGSKLPDFKKIHQQLFANMESASELLKRHQDRGHSLLQSPTPRCALLSPKLITAGKAESRPQKKVQNTEVKPAAPSPLATKLKTPPVFRTPMAARNLVAVTSSVNRFGFRKPVRKEEATSIIGKKLPSISLEKKKADHRVALKGVRMNKRFMLQMQMRQKSGQ